MSKSAKHIIAVLIIVVPFYLTAFFQKILLRQEDFLVEKFFGLYMLLGIIGVAAVLLVNKFWLRNKINVFFSASTKPVYDIALALLLLGSFYFIQSVERISYANWFVFEKDRTAITTLLNDIFSNFMYGLIIIGPFTWIEEAFAVLSVAFILNNLWEVKTDKLWIAASIVFAAGIFALMQINNGPAAMISSLLIISFSNFIYYKYRSIIPLFVAAVLFQSIDLITYWVYF